MFLPKIIEICGNLTKFSQKQICLVFLGHGDFEERSSQYWYAVLCNSLRSSSLYVQLLSVNSGAMSLMNITNSICGPRTLPCTTPLSYIRQCVNNSLILLRSTMQIIPNRTQQYTRNTVRLQLSQQFNMSTARLV